MKRKFLIVALTFVCAVCLALGISACSAGGTDSTLVMEEGIVYFTDFSIKYTSAEDSPNGDIDENSLTDEIRGSFQSYYLVMNFDMQLASNTDGLEYITVKFVVLDADVVETIINYADTSNVSAITSDGQTTITATYSMPDKAKTVKNINYVLELKPKTTGTTYIYYYFSSNTKDISGYTDEDITYSYTNGNISISNKSLEYTLNDDGQSYSVTGIGTKSGDVYVKFKEIYMGLPVTAIGDNAFYNCDLTSITIPDSVTYMGRDAFAFCSLLTSVFYSGTASEWASISFVDSDSNPLSYAGDLYLKGTLATDIVIEGITTINDYAFSRCTSLLSVTISDSVTSICDSAFGYCTALESITIPNSVTSIGDYAFERCTSLESITIPNSVTSIGDYAFQSCTSLRSITIPDSVTSIGDDVFQYCTALTSINVDTGNTAYKSIDGNLYNYDGTTLIRYAIGKADTFFTIPDSVTSIGDYAFQSCTSLRSITIPDSVTSIGDWAFHNCTSLTNITIPDSVTSIGSYAFGYCAALTNVTIGSGVTSIGDNAFRGCTALTSVIIPDSITSISSEAFYGCITLTSITIPDSVTSIGDHAFYGCSSLTSIIIPDSVTSIGKYAFYNCTSLTNVTFENTSGWYIGNGITISSSLLSSSSNAVTYLRSTYCDYKWYRK